MKANQGPKAVATRNAAVVLQVDMVAAAAVEAVVATVVVAAIAAVMAAVTATDKLFNQKTNYSPAEMQGFFILYRQRITLTCLTNTI